MTSNPIPDLRRLTIADDSVSSPGSSKVPKRRKNRRSATQPLPQPRNKCHRTPTLSVASHVGIRLPLVFRGEGNVEHRGADSRSSILKYSKTYQFTFHPAATPRNLNSANYSALKPAKAGSEQSLGTLARLPVEVRLLIYQQLLITPHPIVIRDCADPGKPADIRFSTTGTAIPEFATVGNTIRVSEAGISLALILTSRQIYSEAVTVLYGDNIFEIRHSTGNLVAFAQTARSSAIALPAHGHLVHNLRFRMSWLSVKAMGASMAAFAHRSPNKRKPISALARLRTALPYLTTLALVFPPLLTVDNRPMGRGSYHRYVYPWLRNLAVADAGKDCDEARRYEMRLACLKWMLGRFVAPVFMKQLDFGSGVIFEVEEDGSKGLTKWVTGEAWNWLVQYMKQPPLAGPRIFDK